MLNRVFPLMQREWLQHRNGWFLLAGVPVVLTLLLLISGVGQIQFDSDTLEKTGSALPTFVALATMFGTAMVLFGILWMSSLLISSGLARRDHADRSVEFWLSVPTSHVQSLAVPLLVHLILVPAAALGVGLLAGCLVSAATVLRVVGWSDLAQVQWASVFGASLVFTLRAMGGLVLATLWLSPLILLTVLFTAWFRRWAWVILTVGLGLGAALLEKLFGQPWMSNVIGALFKNAGKAFLTGGLGSPIQGSQAALDTLRFAPSWALEDFGLALRELASPLFVGALLFAAGCFYLLVQWRQRGASAND